jgi:hypothetical protein
MHPSALAYKWKEEPRLHRMHQQPPVSVIRHHDNQTDSQFGHREAAWLMEFLRERLDLCSRKAKVPT